MKISNDKWKERRVHLSHADGTPNLPTKIKCLHRKTARSRRDDPKGGSFAGCELHALVKGA